MWTTDQAIALARKIEKLAPAFGCHVALTGGLLYKDGPRKDCDLVFYRIRQEPKIKIVELFEALALIGFRRVRGWGWVVKAEYHGEPVDCFFPEELNGDDYPGEAQED